jgi:thiol-disulfide isomerase/thioredoxin
LILTGCFEKPLPPVRNITATPAPEFSLQDFSGKALESSSFKGQIVVINFWATWSPGCAKELPDLMLLQKKYQGKVSFIGFALGLPTELDAKKMAEGFGLAYPVAITPSEFHQNFGGIDAIPSSFVIDRQWTVVNRYTGRIRIEELSAELDYMLLPEKK